MALPIKKTSPLPAPVVRKGKPMQDGPQLTEKELLLPLHLKYRPRSFDAVIGQQAVVSSLKKVLSSSNVPHAYLFTGSSGTGKTTLARIVATTLGIPATNILEVDAATTSGVENMRNITELARYKSLRDEEGRRFVIIDEAHALSKATWQSMLKSIEEPPEHVFWALCTTEADKVPETIRTRCTSYNLKKVSTDDLHGLLENVNRLEVLKVTDDILGMLAREAAGSVRQALNYLSKVAGVKDKTEAMSLLDKGVGDEKEAIDLARMLCGSKNNNWAEYMRVCGLLENSSPEGVRLVIINYACAVIREAKDPNRMLAVLHAFREPFYGAEGWAPMYRALGELLL